MLHYLESIGFTAAPRFLGVDAAERDVLTFVLGEVAGRPWPRWVGDKARALSVARLVRAYDDAVQPLGIPEWAHSSRAADPPGCPAPIAGTPRVARNGADRSWHLMHRNAIERGGGWRRMWDDGMGDRILRRQAWLAANPETLHAAIT